MDLDKLRTFIIEHGSDYLHAFAATLKNPSLTQGDGDVRELNSAQQLSESLQEANLI